jgi:hypothetical protein
MNQEPAKRQRQVDDIGIHQELPQIRANLSGRGAIRRSEIQKQKPRLFHSGKLIHDGEYPLHFGDSRNPRLMRQLAAVSMFTLMVCLFYLEIGREIFITARDSQASLSRLLALASQEISKPCPPGSWFIPLHDRQQAGKSGQPGDINRYVRAPVTDANGQLIGHCEMPAPATEPS